MQATDDSYGLIEASGRARLQPQPEGPMTTAITDVPASVARRRTRPRWAGGLRIIALCIAALIAGAFLNADHLLSGAEKKQFGRERDLWLAVWTPVHEVSDSLYLNRPRLWIDDLLGREPASAPFALPGSALSQGLKPRVRLPDVTSQAGPDVAPPTAASVAPATPTRRLPIATPDAPLKLWVGGDSMAAAFGESLLRLSSATGLINPELDARASTGLTRPDFFDWPARLNARLTNDSPDVLVIIFGANDSQGLRTPDGRVFQPDADGWKEDYRRRVSGTMDLVAGPRRLVIWVGQPIMASEGFSRRMADMNTIYREEAAKRPGIVFFDSWPLFTDADGGYSAYITAADGTLINARAGDGVHLTKAGADRLAAAVLERLHQETPIFK